MDQRVDVTVTRRETRCPPPRRLFVEQIHDLGLDPVDLGCQRVERRLVATADGHSRPLFDKLPNDRRSEIPGTARNGDHPSVERFGHEATLATARVERIRGHIGEPEVAMIVPFCMTAHEVGLAEALQLPIYGCDPVLVTRVEDGKQAAVPRRGRPSPGRPRPPRLG
jgi:hypothetical protein